MFNSVVEQLAQRSDIKKWVHDITVGKRVFESDLYQELFLALAEMPEDKLSEIAADDRRLKGYVFGLLRNKLIGEGSFKTQFRTPHYNKVDHIIVDEEGNECDLIEEITWNDIDALVYNGKNKEELHVYLDALERAIPKLNRFEREILETYLALGTVSKVVEAKRVTRRYVHQAIVRARHNLKTLIRAEIENTNN